MSLEQAINHGKEHRKQYHPNSAKSIDWSCRNHGECKWCAENRQFSDKKREFDADEYMEEWADWMNAPLGITAKDRTK